MSDRTQRDSSPLVYGAVPRAFLMPPEVAQRKQERNRRRGLVTLVIVVLFAVIGGTIASYLLAAQSEQRLADERAVTQELLNQQLEFGEVLGIQSRLSSVEQQRTLLESVEVDWLAVIDDYLAVVQTDGVIDGLVLRGNDPFDDPLVLAGPLRSPRSATAQISVLTTAAPDAARWLRAFAAIDTFADASIDTVVLDTADGYLSTITVNLNSDALIVSPVEEETE